MKLEVADYMNKVSYKFTLFGNTENNNLIGGLNEDRLFGSNGDDVLDGRAGSDYLEGGNGTIPTVSTVLTMSSTATERGQSCFQTTSARPVLSATAKATIPG